MLGEMITRRCLLTLDGGAKIQAVLTIPKPTKPIFPKEMERQFIICEDMSPKDFKRNFKEWLYVDDLLPKEGGEK